MSEEQQEQLQHHKQAEVAASRPSYREGRKDRAVKVPSYCPRVGGVGR